MHAIAAVGRGSLNAKSAGLETSVDGILNALRQHGGTVGELKGIAMFPHNVPTEQFEGHRVEAVGNVERLMVLDLRAILAESEPR